MTYFNTTNLAGQRLYDAKASADTLKGAVSQLFTKHKRLSPWQTLRLSEFGTINGVRCVITVLTDEGVLRKTAEKIDGPYGRPEYIWELAAA